MPARNSFEIETLAATPKMTKPIDGGMIGAMIPADGDQAGRARLVVAGRDHHRQQQRRERRGVGDRRARQRGQHAGGMIAT